MFQQLEIGQKVIYDGTKNVIGIIEEVKQSTYAVRVSFPDGRSQLEEWVKHKALPFKDESGEEDNYNPFGLVKSFHQAFNHPAPHKPTVMDFATAYNRSKWVLEELIEHMAATDVEELSAVRDRLHKDLDTMLDTEISKSENNNFDNKEEVLMNQMDALIDQLYFVYGSLVVQGINPENPFKIVNSYNMDKLQDGEIVYKDKERKKIGKRKGWLPPDEDLKEELRRQIKEAEDNV